MIHTQSTPLTLVKTWPPGPKRKIARMYDFDEIAEYITEPESLETNAIVLDYLNCKWPLNRYFMRLRPMLKSEENKVLELYFCMSCEAIIYSRWAVDEEETLQDLWKWELEFYTDEDSFLFENRRETLAFCRGCGTSVPQNRIYPRSWRDPWLFTIAGPPYLRYQFKNSDTKIDSNKDWFNNKADRKGQHEIYCFICKRFIDIETVAWGYYRNICVDHMRKIHKNFLSCGG